MAMIADSFCEIKMETASHRNHPVPHPKTAKVKTREAQDGFELSKTNVGPTKIHIPIGKRIWLFNKHCWVANRPGSHLHPCSMPVKFGCN